MKKEDFMWVKLGPVFFALFVLFFDSLVQAKILQESFMAKGKPISFYYNSDYVLAKKRMLNQRSFKKIFL